MNVAFITINSYQMFRNYLRIAFRNLLRNKGLSTINILGLAIGIASCLIIMLFVNNELSFDRFNDKADRMVRVYFQGNVHNEKMNESNVMPPVAQAMKRDFAEVEDATRLRTTGTPRLVYNGRSFREDEMAYVDSNFLEVFTLPLLEGDKKTALLEPNSVVITKAVAEKYFGNEPAMGKMISFKDGNTPPMKVTGIMEQMPRTSHFHFEILGSMSSLAEARQDSWMTSSYYTYLVLKPGSNYKKLEAKLPGMVEKYLGPQMLLAMGMTLSDFRKEGNSLSFHLQPLTSIHLHSDFPHDLGAPGDIRYVYIFGAIALFMLLIACINFMNLSTAGASKRSREVGIRKVLGSLRADLVRQFLFESILTTAVALTLGLLFVYLALPMFNQISGQQINLHFSEHPFLIPALMLFTLITGVLAGSYPAFYLSSFRPVAVLKGKFVAGKGSIGLRSGLVVFQFFISIILMVSTTVVYKQLSYMRNIELGYNKQQVMIIPGNYLLGPNREAFYQQLLHDPRVTSVSRSSYLPAGPSNDNNFFVYPNDRSTDQVKTLRYDVDENYLSTLGIGLRAGRNFSRAFQTDSSAVILNEAAARAMGWGDNATGHLMTSKDNHGKTEQYHVIGIIKDFHFRSLHERISPLVMTLQPDENTLIAKLNTSNVSGLIAQLSQRWSAMGSEEPISYSFLDDRYEQTYRSEQQLGLILGIFAGLTIFVACLGLFGLAKFTAEQRTKEIGIRKVLGASVVQVSNMLSKEFIRLVLVACIVSFPIAYLAMHKWLEDYEYRIDVSWWIFLAAGVSALLIAVLTVSFQAIKAALANPITSLRSE